VDKNNPFASLDNEDEDSNPFASLDSGNEDTNPFTNPEPVKSRHPLKALEEEVPYVGHIVGGIADLSTMFTQFIGTGTSQLAKVTGAVDQEFVDDVAGADVFTPKTETGAAIHGAIGKAMAWWYENTKYAGESMVNQLPTGTPAPIQGVMGAMGAIVQEGIPLVLPGMLPYAPKYVVDKVNEYKQARATADASPNSGTAPTVPSPGNERINYAEFNKIYKESNPKASIGEVAGAWGEYAGNGIRDAYEILAATPSYKRKAAGKSVQASTPDSARSLSFKEQLDLVKDSPITLTKQEFAQGVQTAGYARPVAALKAEKKSLQALVPKLIDTVKQRKILARVEEISKQLKALSSDLKSPKTQGMIDQLYTRYLAERGTTYDTLFDTRQREAIVLKAMQEEKVWQDMEVSTGRGRLTNSMQISTLPIEKTIEVQKQVRSATSSKVGLPKEKVTVPDLTAIGKDARNYMDKGGKPQDAGKPTVTPTPLMDGLSKELGEVYKPGMSFEHFKGQMRGKLAGMPDHITKAIYDKIHKPSSVSGAGKPLDKMKSMGFSGQERGIVGDTIEFVGGKMIGMLFDKAKYSPILQSLLDKMMRREIQQYKPGEVHNQTSVIQAQRLAMGEWSIRLQNLYDQAQIKLGGGSFVGPKNLIPEKLGGWGAKSLPTKMNTMLHDMINGKPRPDAPEALQVMAKQIRQIENDFFNYLKEAGLEVEFIENHFARMWDADKIKSMRPQFEKMLSERDYNPKQIEDIILSLTENGGMVDLPMKGGKLRGEYIDGDIRSSKLAHNVELTRKLQGLSVDDIRPFVNSNVHQVMVKYLEQGTRRAETARAFGIKEQFLDETIPKVQQELQAQGKSLTYQEVRRIYEIVDALNSIHKFNKYSNLVNKWPRALGNFFALPFAVISSMAEGVLPLMHGGILAYSKAIPTAVHTMVIDFARTNIHKGIPKTELMEFAESIGKAGEIMSSERIHQMMNGLDPSVLDGFTFATNLLHSWNKFMNYTAADIFRSKTFRIAKNNGKMDAYTERLYNYLGLPKQELAAWHKRGLGEKDPFYKKIQEAGHIFVEDVVLVSNPVVRPPWHNDHTWALLSHLKGFPVMMGNTVVKRMAVDLVWAFKNTRSFPEHGTKILATGMLMTLVAYLSNELKDQLKYGPKGNPSHADDTQADKVYRAIKTAGFGGMISNSADALNAGEYANMGYVGALAGGPSLGVFDQLLSLVQGVRTGNANLTAELPTVYTEGLVNIYKKFGIVDGDELTKKEIKGAIADLFHDYFGMELNNGNSGGGVRAIRAK
jgi:hypothetical protein